MNVQEDKRIQRVTVVLTSADGGVGDHMNFDGMDVTFQRNDDGSLLVKCVEYGVSTGHILFAAGKWHHTRFYRERDPVIERHVFKSSIGEK